VIELCTLFCNPHLNALENVCMKRSTIFHALGKLDNVIDTSIVNTYLPQKEDHI